MVFEQFRGGVDDVPEQSRMNVNPRRVGATRRFRSEKTLTVVAVVMVLGVLAGSGVVDLVIHRVSRDKNHTTLATVLDTTHQALHSWASENRSTTAFWAETPDVVSVTARLLEAPRNPEGLLSDPAQAELRAFLAPVLAAKGYRGFFVIAPDGTSLASTRDANVGTENLLARSRSGALERILAGETLLTLPQVSDVPLTDADGVLRDGLPTMFVGAPVRSASGEVIAAFTFRIDPNADFIAIFGQGRVGATGETLAFDGEALLLSESRFEEELRRVGHLDSGEVSPLNVELRRPGEGLASAHPLTLMAASALSGLDGADLEGYRSYLGTEVVGVWEWDEHLGIGIAAEMTLEEANRVARWSRWAMMGLTAGMVISIIGLTAMFRGSQRTLRESEHRYRRLIEEAADAVVAIDASQRVVIFNQLAEELFGYRAEEVTGAHIDLLLPEGARPAHSGLVAGFIGDPGSRRRMAPDRPDVGARRKDGTVFPAEVTIGKADLGDESLYMATVRDVTEARRNAVALERLTEDLRARNEDLQQFVWIASHDLREPLRKVEAFGGQLEEAMGEHLDEWGKLSLDRIVDAARRMSLLLDDLMVFSRVTTQASTFRPIDLNQAAITAIDALAVLVEETDGRVEAGVLPVVEGDATQLTSVLQNLIGNALKFHRPDVPPVVGVYAETGDGVAPGWVRVVVEDNGIGFDSDYAERIFEPFQRLHQRGDYQGNGMGLTIGRRIVERHGGRLRAEQVPGIGSRFVVELPIRQPEEATP